MQDLAPLCAYSSIAERVSDAVSGVFPSKIGNRPDIPKRAD
jgi:hypothetical protein